MAKFLDLEGLGYYTTLVKEHYDPEITLLRTFMAYVGYAEVTNIETTSIEFQLKFYIHSYYEGSGTITHTGVLASRVLPLNTDLTTDNCEGDFNSNRADFSTIIKDKDNGLGVSVKPYIEIDNIRHYGVQQRYFYNDFV